MKRIVLKYGGLSALMLVGTFTISLIVAGGCGKDYAKQEIIGYTSMFLSMLFVYFGMRQYRDRVSGGTMPYLQGLKVGLLISLLPSVAFGIFNVIYVKYLDPGFTERYYNQAVQDMKAKQMPAEELAKQLKEMEASKAMFSNVFLTFLLMAVTVLIIGMVVSAVSALILQRRRAVELANA